MPILYAVLLVAIAGSTRGQSLVERPVRWTGRAAVTSLLPGDTVRVTLHASIAEFFHLYSTTQPGGGPIRTSVTLASPGWTQIGALRVPTPDTIPDDNFGILSEVYSDSATIGLTISAPNTVGSRLTVAVRFQTCTPRVCLPPRTDTVKLLVRIAGVAPPASLPVEEASPSPTARGMLAASSPESFGRPASDRAFLLFAGLMGAFALLTPCVFPMVPITVSSFLSRSASRRQSIGLASLYAFGIIASFSALGLACAILFGAAGLSRLSANPVVNLAIASFFLLFATSLIAGKSFSLPGWLVERMSAFQLGSGSGGVVLMGMIFTLTAFTCTAPFIGSLLVVASQGNWRWPLAGMLVFSSVLAAPFFVIALVPGVLGRGRRSARWMPVTELALGGVEVGAAVKFVSNADLVLGWGVFTRAAVISLWIAILAGLVVTTLARYRRSGLVHACFVVGLIGYLAPGLFGRRLGEFEAFLPPMSQSATRGEPLWLLNDYDAALRIAVRQRRPVLIDFTGYTCTNCRWMEANMFPREDLRRALDQFVRVRLYTDGIGHPYDAQQRMEQTMFATIALPMYGVVDPAGEPRARFLGMTRSASEFVSFLTRSAR